MIEPDKHKTAVIFRKWRKRADGGVIALFPEIPCDAYRFYVMSYEHMGQHGGADYAGVMFQTLPATEEEFITLKRELERLGYNLAVYQRRTERMRKKCQGRIP